ncbi:MAG: phenylalanine--tRNA ligase subunit beta [Bdellovibrionota bacterium]
MYISWKWLSEFVDLNVAGSPEKLADILTSRGLEVEEVNNLGRGLEKVITARILEKSPHPQADRLSLCRVTTGQGDDLQIVCGARNMQAGDCVALAQIGAQLPNGVKIEQSKIRGAVSCGMLCSEDELGFKKNSDGILILPGSTPVGLPLAEVLGLDDTILTFKLTANRGDCLSHMGIAREVAAALVKKVKLPVFKELDFERLGYGPVAVSLKAGELGQQFFGCFIEGVKIGPSPAWLKNRLEKLGIRSINNVVDATNLVLLEMGHPTHAYDASLLKGGQVDVRLAKKGETLALLDGGTITLDGTELVIADKERPVGLAGVMGGGNSEVRETTTSVFLECAEFDSKTVRKTAQKHQRRTEASHRFERGIDPLGLSRVISRLSGLVCELAGGRVLGAVRARTASREFFKPLEISVNFGYFPSFLGMEVTRESAGEIFSALGCTVRKDDGKGGDNWVVSVPSYRNDLCCKEDLAEEVARSLGYDKIAETVPKLSSRPSPSGTSQSAIRLALMDKAKDVLKQLGFCETVNFAFSSKAWLGRFDGYMNNTHNVSLLNPLSEEHEVLVPSLLPGLIKNSLDSWRHHFGSEPLAIRLFELRPTFNFAGGDIRALNEMETVVRENWKLSLAVSGPRYMSALRNEQSETDFYDIKAVFDCLFDALGTRGIRYQTGANRAAEIFHPGKSAEVLAGKEVAGRFGLFHPAKAAELKADAPLWIAEIDWSVIERLSLSPVEFRSFKPWSEFPPIERDFALLVQDNVMAEKITQIAIKAGKPLAKTAKIFDTYRGSQVAEGMTSIAVRVVFFGESGSLKEADVDAVSAKILEAWRAELGAELRS